MTKPKATLARRTFLGTGALSLLALAARKAFAFGEAARLEFAILRHSGRFDVRPDALPRLAWEVSKRTSIETTPVVRAYAAVDPDLFKHPLLVLASDGEIPTPGDAEIAALRRYLSYGGFLLLDDSSATKGGAFERSAKAFLAAIIPGAQLTPVARTHVIYKSFYLLDGPSGRTNTMPDLLGVELGGRLAVAYSGNDLLGALARDSLGTWEFEVTPGGESQRERAIRLGVNLVMYTMCLDYKEDQVHIPFIMKRRRI